MLQNYRKFQSQNVQIFGCVYQNTSGQNHGPVWKTQSFLLNEICTVIFGRTTMGKAFWENPIAARLEKSSKLRMLFCKPREMLILVRVCGRYLNWRRRTKTLIRCGKYSSKKSMWEKQHLSLTMFSRVVLNESVKQAKISWTIIETCLKPKYLQERMKKLPSWRKHFSMVLLYGRSRKGMCGAILRTGVQNNSTVVHSRNFVPWRP